MVEIVKIEGDTIIFKDKRWVRIPHQEIDRILHRTELDNGYN